MDLEWHFGTSVSMCANNHTGIICIEQIINGNERCVESESQVNSDFESVRQHYCQENLTLRRSQ